MVVNIGVSVQNEKAGQNAQPTLASFSYTPSKGVIVESGFYSGVKKLG